MTLDLDKELKELRQMYNEKPYPTLKERKELLSKIKNVVLENEANFIEALKKDYGYRSDFDTQMLDLLPTVNYINYISKKLKTWMKKSKRHSGLLLLPSKVEVHYQPVGVVGVIVPWNFPINLSLGPAVSAIGAGNKVMIKMSEFTPNINKAMVEAFSHLKEHLRFYEGEVEVSAKFSSLNFDHLLFTGSTNVGKIVAKAAADNLTPITLELGGKSPTIITEDANLSTAIDSIIMGKTFNSGQICVAPDYLFIPESKKEEFKTLFVKKVNELFSNEFENGLTHIINDNHYNRLKNLLEDAKEKGATLTSTKNTQGTNTQMYPTLVDGVNDDMKIMQEEIFGSLLPMMTYKDLKDVVSYIKERPRPLALYLMANNKKDIDYILKNTHSGGVCINDCVLHVGADDAPFGGVGDSGIGQYHGHEGFITFSKAKTVLSSKSFVPRSWFVFKYRDTFIKVFKKVFFK